MTKLDITARFNQNIFSFKSIKSNLRSFLFFVAFLLLLLPGHAVPQAARIGMDGYFSDWGQLEPIYAGSLKNQSAATQFFGKLWAANDERFLFLRVELGAEINLQNDNSIVLYLDTDNNAATGKSVHGIGAELEWYFGEKTGTFFSNGSSYQVRHRNIGLITMPTITSIEFEICLERAAKPVNQQPLFSGTTVGIVFENKATGDFIPNSGDRISYNFDDTALAPIKPISLNKKNENHLRVVTYNVLRDNLFKQNQRKYFERILRAIQPDIIGFEEIYDHSADETALQVESMLPSAEGEYWYRARVDPDIIAISRYPIVKSYAIDGNGAFLIQLSPRYDRDLLLIVAHPPSGSRNYERQREIDAIMAFVREAKKPGGTLELQPNTPIVIVGDMNLVGYAEQLRTFLTGEIANLNQYGPAFRPDWDGTDFTALLPRQTDLLLSFTWYDENNSFSPGRLDYIIFSDSAIKPGNHFILFTPEMSPDSLAKHGLQPGDVLFASDHLPVVSDFVLPLSTDIELDRFSYHPGSISLNQNYPNPFNPGTVISYWLPEQSLVALKIYNLLGEEVAVLVDSIQARGQQSMNWNGRDKFGNPVESGVYFYRLQVNERVLSRKMVVLH